MTAMRAALGFSWCLRVFVIILPCAVALACTGEKVKAPASDQNFDDPDEPGTPGLIGAIDASTADVIVTCVSDVDCPPRAARCLFRVGDGCRAVGTCVNYVEATACPKTRFCDCFGGGVSACAPEGLSPVPVQEGAVCVEPDAATSTDASATVDAAADAPNEGG